jgi:hypothetical protein
MCQLYIWREYRTPLLITHVYCIDVRIPLSPTTSTHLKIAKRLELNHLVSSFVLLETSHEKL